MKTFTHNGIEFTAKGESADTDFGPENKVTITEVATGHQWVRQEAATTDMIVEWWVRDQEDSEYYSQMEGPNYQDFNPGNSYDMEAQDEMYRDDLREFEAGR